MAEASGVIATEPVRVDVRSVEKELANLWHRATEGGIPGVSASVTRTLLSNLLVYASTDQQAEDASRVISQVTARHPSRAVIADAQLAEAGGELSADIAMLCNVSERGRRLCGEQVRLHAHGVTAAALGSIMPVLVPDLPVYLWTPGDIEDGEVFQELAHIADHWIIDSRKFLRWNDRFRMAISLGPRHEPPVMLHDLAWASLSQWREAVAQHFDPQPARGYLGGVKSVEISYRPGDGGRPNIESVLMTAWLIRQLEWEGAQVRNVSSGVWTLSASGGDGPVNILLKPAPDADLPVVGVMIESDMQGRRGVFRSTRADHPGELWIEADCPDVPAIRRTMILGPESRPSELCSILDTPGKDRLYDQALPIIQGLVLEIEGRA